MSEYFEISTDGLRARISREREAARRLKSSTWWKAQIRSGHCGYCGQMVGERALTMDHRVPVARGGRTTPGNVIPSCRSCNQAKGLNTPVDLILAKGRS